MANSLMERDLSLQEDIMRNVDPEKACSVGLDFGSHSSKQGISRKKGDLIQIFRVQLNVDPGDPDYSNDNNEVNNVFEFNSKAALVNGQLVTGKQAKTASIVDKDVFCLKTMLMYCAGITARETLHKAPSGKALLKAIGRRRIHRLMMMKCLVAHFEFLRDQALKRVHILQAVVTELVLTHPNFLSGRGHAGDFRKFCRFYLELLEPIWKEYKPVVKFVSEGRAVALYVCETFQIEDSDCLFDRQALFDELQDLVVDGALNLKFFDGGGSTLNIEDIGVYLNPNNTVSSTQANVSVNSITGTLGGSNLSNSEVQDAILNRLPDVEPQQLAEFMNKFETWKWNVTSLEIVDDIELIGTNRNSWVQVPAEVLTRALKSSFQPGLDALRRETKNALLQKKNQGFIFCGGGYRNPGVREEVRKIHEEHSEQASKLGIKLKHIYLSQFDKTWMSAVSVGAAVSAQCVPNPLEVWQGSAIALHVYMRSKGKWVDTDEAQVLVSNKWGVAPKLCYPGRPKVSVKRRFNLVCDPTYSADNQWAMLSHQPVKIYPELEVLHGPLSCYHLDFELDLPAKPVEFQVFGDILDQLSRPLSGTTAADSITFGLAYTVGQPGSLGFEQRLWHITLKVSPASKLLYVFRAIEMPFRCSKGEKCQSAGERVVVEKVHQCLICMSYSVCDDCWTFGQANHAHESFEMVNLVQGAPGHYPQGSASREPSLGEVSVSREAPPGGGHIGEAVLSAQDAVSTGPNHEAPSQERARLGPSLPARRSFSHGPGSSSREDQPRKKATGNGSSTSKGGCPAENAVDWEEQLRLRASEAEDMIQLSALVQSSDEDEPIITFVGPRSGSQI